MKEREIKSHVNTYFQTLFHAPDLAYDKNLFRLEYIFKFFENNDATELNKDISEDELKHALFSMDAWKAPGPNGFQAGFFQSDSEMISHDFYIFSLSMWRNPEDIGLINTTNICLNPKVPKPGFVNQFRPISLCNVSYKAHTKVIDC